MDHKVSRLVAACGSLWRPVAACGTGVRPPIEELLRILLGIIRSSGLEAWRHAWADHDDEDEDADEGFDWRNSHTLEL